MVWDTPISELLRRRTAGADDPAQQMQFVSDLGDAPQSPLPAAPYLGTRVTPPSDGRAPNVTPLSTGPYPRTTYLLNTGQGFLGESLNGPNVPRLGPDNLDYVMPQQPGGIGALPRYEATVPQDAGRVEADYSAAPGGGPPPAYPPETPLTPFQQEMQRTGNTVYNAQGNLRGRYDPDSRYIMIGNQRVEPSPDNPLRPLHDLAGSILDNVHRRNVYSQEFTGGPLIDPTRALESQFGSTLAHLLGTNRLIHDRELEFGRNGIPGRQQRENDMAYGIGGTRGAIGNAAINADAANRANSPQTQYAAFYLQAYNSFPPGTPHGDRVRKLTRDGMPPPAFLSGGGAGSGGGAVSPTGGIGAPAPRAGGAGANAPGAPTTAGQTPDATSSHAAAIDNAFETGLSIFPRDPATGARRADANGAHEAVTRILSSIPDDVLRANFDEIRQRLIDTMPEGARTLDNWLNTSNTPLANMSMSGRNQQREIARVSRILGIRPTPISPWNTGAGWFQRGMSALNPMAPLLVGGNHAYDWLTR